MDEAELRNRIVALRRDLHSRPELSGKEEATERTIAAFLKGLRGDLELTTGIAGHGIKAVLRGRKPGRTIAIRADMDALPIQEELDLPFRSTHEGVMHACGHDGHCAVVAGAALCLTERLGGQSLETGNVVFLFQPAEETPPGGARFMIEAGVLHEPEADEVLGLHNSPLSPSGTIVVPEGPVTAASDVFSVSFRGQGGHGARPEACVDTVAMASHFVVMLQSMVTRKFAPSRRPVISIGSIAGGSAHNIIPKEVRMEGTVRSLYGEGEKIEGEMRGILDSLTGLFGGSYELLYRTGYPQVSNDPGLARELRDLASESPWVSRVESSSDPSYVADDFGYFSSALRSCYFIFGVGASGVVSRDEPVGALHTGTYRMDDTVLSDVSNFVADFCLHRLERMEK